MFKVLTRGKPFKHQLIRRAFVMPVIMKKKEMEKFKNYPIELLYCFVWKNLSFFFLFLNILFRTNPISPINIYIPYEFRFFLTHRFLFNISF